MCIKGLVVCEKGGAMRAQGCWDMCVALRLRVCACACVYVFLHLYSMRVRHASGYKGLAIEV